MVGTRSAGDSRKRPARSAVLESDGAPLVASPPYGSNGRVGDPAGLVALTIVGTKSPYAGSIGALEAMLTSQGRAQHRI